MTVNSAKSCCVLFEHRNVVCTVITSFWRMPNLLVKSLSACLVCRKIRPQPNPPECLLQPCNICCHDQHSCDFVRIVEKWLSGM